MAVIALVIASLCVALFEGCGGKAPRYSLGATYSCLDQEGVYVTDHLNDADYFSFDPIARAARGGALRAVFASNSVVVVFERSEDDARRVEAAYEDAPPVFPDPTRLENIAQRVRNAVVLWLRPPTDEEAAQLDKCLRE